MSKHLAVVSLVVLSLVAVGSHGDEVPGYTRFLVPIYVPPTPGAYGSIWEATTWIRYAGTEPARMVPRPFCYGIQCPLDGQLEPGWPSVPFHFLVGFPWPAVVVYVEREHASEVTFGSRIRDTSRMRDSAGTQVPVVREDQMTTGPVAILNVPVAPRFRHTLRVYALPDAEAPEVEVRYFRQPDPSGPRLDLLPHLLRVDRVQLRTRASALDFNHFPPIAEITSIETFPEVSGESTMWIEVVPTSPNTRVWAMLSITNNETQQVTLVTPTP